MDLRNFRRFRDGFVEGWDTMMRTGWQRATMYFVLCFLLNLVLMRYVGRCL